jgi:hypothetical protein
LLGRCAQPRLTRPQRDAGDLAALRAIVLEHARLVLVAALLEQAPLDVVLCGPCQLTCVDAQFECRQMRTG